MTDNTTFWKALQEYLPRGRWIPLTEILATVRQRVRLDEEDLVRASSRSARLHWELNVRRLLRSKMHLGRVRTRRDP